MQAERLGAEGQHGRTPLHVACQAGDVNTICLLISEKKCETSGRDAHGNTPIHIAAFCGHKNVVKLLVWEFSCSAEESNLNGDTPVHAACRGGHADIVRLLVSEMKCSQSEKNGDGWAPIHLAALNGHEMIVKLLVEEFGCNPEERKKDGWTPLHFACQGGHVSVVRLLVSELKCEPSVNSEKGFAPIHIAACHGHEIIVKLLAEEFCCNPGEKGGKSWTPLLCACARGHVSVVRLLVSELKCEPSVKSERGDVPIHIASRYGHEIIVKLLAEEFGCNPGERGGNGWTPLHYACRAGHVSVVRLLVSELKCEPSVKNEHGNAPIHIASRYGHEIIVKLLAEEFVCNPGERGENSWTPLHYACQGGHIGVVRLLVSELKCEPSVKDEVGNAPIHSAAQNGHEMIVKLLVEEFGCNPEERGENGFAPLHYACQGGHIGVVRLLVSELKCEPSVKDEVGNAPIHSAAQNGHEMIVKLLAEEFGCNPGERGQKGETPLHYACRGGHVSVVRLLVSELKCEPSVKGEGGDTPILRAALYGHEIIVKLLAEEFGCNPGEKGQNGWTPLHYACVGGHIGVVRLLVSELKCEPSVKNEHGNAPIHIASRYGHEIIVKLLAEEFVCNPGEKEQNGWTPLHYACVRGHVSVVRLLLYELKCIPSVKSEGGDAPIHFAANNGHEGIVKLLAEEFGCNPGEKGHNGWTPLHYACVGGHVSVVRLLLYELKCMPSVKSEDGNAPIHIAASNGHEIIVKLLAEEFGCNPGERGRNGWTPLHCACRGGHVSVVRLLVSELKCEPSVKGEGGDAPIVSAALHGHEIIVKLLAEEFGCNPGEKEQNGWTLLHYACAGGHVSVVRLLVSELKCEPSVKSEGGNAPIHIAADYGHEIIVKLLADECGCNPWERGKNGWTPLHYACAGGHVSVVRLLVSEMKCEPSLKSEHSNAVEKGQFGRMLLTAASQQNVLNSLCTFFGLFGIYLNGVSPLEIAVMSGNISIVKEFVGHLQVDKESGAIQFLEYACETSNVDLLRILILSFGCDPKLLSSKPSVIVSPLDIAICSGAVDLVHTLISDFGVSTTDKNDRGRTSFEIAAEGGNVSIIKEFAGHIRIEDHPMALHNACLSGSLEAVCLLISDFGYDPMAVDKAGLTALHVAASINITEMVKELAGRSDLHDSCFATLLHYLISRQVSLQTIRLLLQLGIDPASRDDNGFLPIHKAAQVGRADIVCALVNDFNCSPSEPGHNGRTPLHEACLNCHLEVVRLLITDMKCNSCSLDNDKNTPLHLATLCPTNTTVLIRELIQQCDTLPHCLNCMQQTPLHLAAGEGKTAVVKMLYSEFHCSPIAADTEGNTPFHMAAMSGRINLLKELAELYGSLPDSQNNSQQTALHLALASRPQRIVDLLSSEFQWNASATDIDGNTVLHLAARKENVDLIISLLSEHKVCSNPKNKSGHTPLYYAVLNRNSRIVAELVKYDCNPAAFDDDYKILEQLSQSKLSDGSLTKVFVIGNKSVGKSTLIEALKNESQQDSSFAEKVTPHTAGIIPSVHQSEHYGRVLFYDFAGDPEYYSSHAAALERLLTSSCHIFLLVEDFSKDEETILQNLGYWLTFISYNSKELQTKSQVIVVGSHADCLESINIDSDRKVGKLFTEISSKFEKNHQYVEMVGFCSLDCRKYQSKGAESLYSLLKHCCLLFSAGECKQVSVGAMLLLGVLQRDFKGVIACEVSQICRHIQLTEMYLPQGVVTVYSYLQELNSQGIILILGNREGLSEEWVILDVSEFLATVHKTLFTSRSLSHVSNLMSVSNTGLVSESHLKTVFDEFADFDVNLLKQCLKHLQYCIEVDDSEVLQKIFETSTSEASSLCHTLNDKSAVEGASLEIGNSGSKLLFFPALLKSIQQSEMKWYCESYSCCKGWYIECEGDYDYFPPRFLHVLLLRLAFKFTLPACSSRRKKNLGLCSRRCRMWKSGIHWLMKTDVECVVEVVKQNKGVVVMIKGKEEFDNDCTCVFSEIVGKVLEAKQEFCHSLVANHYLISPDDMSKNLIPSVKDLHFFDMREIKEALTSNENAVVSTVGHKTLSLSRLHIQRMWNMLFPDILTVDHVLKSIDAVVNEWFRLGLELGVPHSTLETIKCNHPTDVEACKMKMVEQWLKQPRPLWCSLVEALNEIGLKYIAKKIAEKYSNTTDVIRMLQNVETADTEITDEFIDKFAVVLGSRWPLLASLLSFTTDEIWQITNNVIGKPSVKAAAMMKRWRDNASATFGILTDKLTAVLMDPRELPLVTRGRHQ